jgi:nicotinate-nucleotide adenylyltransferase
MRIGVLGGSFDPFHLGHLRAAIELVEQLDLTELKLIPAAQSPHRAPTHFDGDTRVRLIARSIDGVPKLTLDRREIDRIGLSFTVSTLRELRAELRPDAALFLALGTDAYAAFERWREPAAIRALAQIVVMARPGAALPNDPRVRALEIPALEISSTTIRDKLVQGLSVRGLISEAARAELGVG